MEKVLSEYEVVSNRVSFKVSVVFESGELARKYVLSLPFVDAPTKAVLDHIKGRLMDKLGIRGQTDTMREAEELKKRFVSAAEEELVSQIPGLGKSKLRLYSAILVNEMLGLGYLDVLLDDPNLEEIAVNNSSDPVWVYHRKFGWLFSNVVVSEENQIYNYASAIGRRVGRSINILDPLMDAHLLTGDRVNATLFPISTKGNTLTIRKFRRRPFTITDLVKSGTVTVEAAAFLWLAVEYELSLIVAGGTASGKTTFLNTLLPFIPANQRIVSIEDTRELNLPSFLHWIPLTTREPNPEGRGEVTMLELLVNSLRMRPDRIVVGEIRRKEEAEVLFEALNTGHAVYGTFHADTAAQTVRRLTSPPIDLHPSLVESLPLVTVMYRQRRLGVRRLWEVSEVLASREGSSALNTVFKWDARGDRVEKVRDSVRMFSEFRLHLGMSIPQIKEAIGTRARVLQWVVDQNVVDLERIGRVVNTFGVDPDSVLKAVEKKKKVESLGV